MSRPQNNGLVEFIDEKPAMDGSWNCMDLIGFMFDDSTTKAWEVWHKKFTQAKAGNCLYRNRCPRYARTKARRSNEPIQLTLF